jgi:hypothetical protein
VNTPAAEIDSTKPLVLVIGTTGQVGKLIKEEFDRDRLTASSPTST